MLRIWVSCWYDSEFMVDGGLIVRLRGSLRSAGIVVGAVSGASVFGLRCWTL